MSPEPRQCAECSQDRPVLATSSGSATAAREGALGSVAVSTAAHCKLGLRLPVPGLTCLISLR